MLSRARVYYHLSKTPGLSIIDPKWTDPDNSSKAEAKACRICVSSSVLGCLRSLQPYEGDQYYVYVVTVDKDTPFIPSKYVQHLVPDAKHTKECWVMQSTRCLCDGKIEVTEGGNILLDPKWKWVDRYGRDKTA